MLGLWDWSHSRKSDCNPGLRRGPSPQLILPLFPRCKSSLVLSSTWHGAKRMVFTDVLEIWSSTVSSGGQCWQQWCSLCRVLFQHLSIDRAFAKRGFPLLTSQSPISGQSSFYLSPVNICGWGRNLERGFHWVMAKIIDKKPTPLAGLTSNNLDWPPRGKWATSGQCISETSVGPVISETLCLFWASSCETGPWLGIAPGIVSQARQQAGQLSISSPPALQPLKNCWGLNRYHGGITARASPLHFMETCMCASKQPVPWGERH